MNQVGGRSTELHGKVKSPYLLPRQIARAFDKLRGETPRNTFFRKTILPRFLREDPVIPRGIVLSRQGKRVRFFAEFSSQEAEAQRSWGRRNEVGSLTKVSLTAVVWYFRELQKEMAVASLDVEEGIEKAEEGQET